MGSSLDEMGVEQARDLKETYAISAAEDFLQPPITNYNLLVFWVLRAGMRQSSVILLT